MRAPGERIVLAEGGARGAHAVVLEDDAVVVEGGARWQRRRVAYRRVYGLERAGRWLWVGVCPLALAIGGKDVRCEQLARVEAALRARVSALPDGARRLARFDLRRVVRLRLPWLTALLTLVLAIGFTLEPGSQPPLRFATDLLLMIAVALLAEPWLGALRIFASGSAALLAASAWPAQPGELALAPLVLAFGWAGSLAFSRLFREHGLGVRFRSALDTGALLAVALVAHAFSVATEGGGLLLAGLAGFAVAPLLLRGW